MHVGTCPEGLASMKSSKKARRGPQRIGGHPATVYGSKEAFDISQKRRRCKMLARYFEKFDEATRKEVVRDCATELRVLDIADRDIAKESQSEVRREKCE